jgi:hypothetical protein
METLSEKLWEKSLYKRCMLHRWQVVEPFALPSANVPESLSRLFFAIRDVELRMIYSAMSVSQKDGSFNPLYCSVCSCKRFRG